MTYSDDEPRRPPPSTGRQDRHRPAPTDPVPDPRGEPAGPLPPRGAAHYAKGRTHQLGLGCLVALFVFGAGAALILLVLGLSPSGEFVPAGGDVPRAAVTENPAGGTAPSSATAETQPAAEPE